MRLSAATQHLLPAAVERAGYAREQQRVGIIHLGLGGFHRAHQAWYTDRAMDAGDRDWAICGVTMISHDLADRMAAQDGLYVVGQRSGDERRLRLVASIRETLAASQAPERVLQRLAAPDTHLVSLTITERGYCRAADGGLDEAAADTGPFYPLIAQGLRRRRDAGLGGLTLLSCDNMADNGHQLERLLGDHLQRVDPALLGWFQAECRCPSTMVDRMVPAPTDADRDQMATWLGLRDEAAVMTEAFSQWVIEDRFAGPRPRWEHVGAVLVDDVRAYEAAKLGMLNAAHSALAYLGLARGHVHVHEAIADPALRPLIERLMREEAAPTLEAAPGQDLARYADELLQRFGNASLRHRLAQIAIDGSQKIPQRWLRTLAVQQQAGRACPALNEGVGAWLAHLTGINGVVEDSRADELAAVLRAGDVAQAALAMFGPRGQIGSAWTPTPADLAEIEQAFSACRASASAA